MMLNAEGNIIYQSPSTERIFGFAEDEVLGKSRMESIHPHDFDIVLETNTRSADNPGVPQMAIYRVKNKVKGWVWSEGTITSLLDNKDINAYVVNFRDVNDRITYLQEIEKQNDILGEIAWTQSHVVRAPLARVMGLVNLLLQAIWRKKTKLLFWDIFQLHLLS